MSNGNGHRWSKFWWQDWDREISLKRCSLAARGLWMAMLCIAHEATPTGYVTVNGRSLTTKQLAAIVGAPEREVKKLLEELESTGVFSRSEDGAIYCRRMVRDAAAEAESSAAWQAHGKNGGNPQIIRGTVVKEERQRPYRRSDAPQKTQRIFERAGGKCHWCGVILIRTNPTHPHYFHVDHVVAVRDGGSNDEANLVAACQACNMKRARHETTPGGSEQPDPPPPMHSAYRQPGTISDSNPQPIPTAIRQQPCGNSDTKPDSNQSLEADSEAEAEERKEEESKSNLLSFPTPAREDQEPPPRRAVAMHIATKAIVEKLGRAFESSGKVPTGKPPRLSVGEQIVEVVSGPALEGQVMPPDFSAAHHRPVEPQRTVAEQLAALGYPRTIQAAAE